MQLKGHAAAQLHAPAFAPVPGEIAVQNPVDGKLEQQAEKLENHTDAFARLGDYGRWR
ncbi:MAG: hypothetical protein VYE18_02465 [Pseudomonadota bacterium]|nr:hypothetical protein [Pseudomonadota bacterium]